MCVYVCTCVCPGRTTSGESVPLSTDGTDKVTRRVKIPVEGRLPATKISFNYPLKNEYKVDFLFLKTTLERGKFYLSK